MKTREFTINTADLEMHYVNMIEEYIIEDLEIPQDYIESLKIDDDQVNIKLSNTRKYFNDDWYVNLQRVS